MTKTSKSICFFLAFVSIVCGIIRVGEQHTAGRDIEWLAVGAFVAIATFLFLITSVFPDIAGPGAGLETGGSSDDDAGSDASGGPEGADGGGDA